MSRTLYKTIHDKVFNYLLLQRDTVGSVFPSLPPCYGTKGRKGGGTAFRQRFRRSLPSPVASSALEMVVDRGIIVRL